MFAADVADVVDELPGCGVEVSGIRGATTQRKAARNGKRHIPGNPVVRIDAKGGRIEERIHYSQVDNPSSCGPDGINQIRSDAIGVSEGS